MDCGRGRRCGRLLTRMPMALRLLVLLMALDYLSGVGVALLGKKPEERGRRAEQPGGVRRSGAQGDDFGDRPSGRRARSAHGSAACTGAATMFYIVNESLSILENAVLLGVPVPQRLRQALDVRGSPPTTRRKTQRRLNVAGVQRPPHPARRAQETFFKERVDKSGRVSYNIHVAPLVYEVNMR